MLALAVYQLKSNQIMFPCVRINDDDDDDDDDEIV